VWLIKEKKIKAIYLFTESLKYEMLIIKTRNKFQTKILLGDHTANWRVRTKGHLLLVKSTSALQRGQWKTCAFFHTFIGNSTMIETTLLKLCLSRLNF
jgi:hypothetical protein